VNEDDVYGILDLLVSRGFDPSCKAKLVRHQDKRWDVNDLIRDGWMNTYQSLQTNDIYKGCEYAVTFTGDGGSRAKLLAVYRVVSVRAATLEDIPESSPFAGQVELPLIWYVLEYQDQYADLEGRVVIEWGKSARAWHQRMRNKPIIEIYPPGRSLQPFSDYLDFSLNHNELKDLIANPSAHRDWYSSLMAVAGIYLILAETTGQQYVGSAYGSEGIWGRWSQYASNGHGNNKLVRELVKAHPDYPKAFRFSILQVLPKSTKDAEVIRWESRYKEKLGSRAMGLNSN
jgi:hypothetical protein